MDGMLKAMPAPWFDGVPELPEHALKICPGSVTTSWLTAAGLTRKLELAGPVIVLSLAVMLVVSAFLSVVASVVVDFPLVKLTLVV